MTKTNRMGSTGNCICPKCGFKTTQSRGVPCQEDKFLNYGSKMLREDSYHHELLKKKKNEGVN